MNLELYLHLEWEMTAIYILEKHENEARRARVAFLNRFQRVSFKKRQRNFSELYLISVQGSQLAVSKICPGN